jgi:hypothetical protein
VSLFVRSPLSPAPRRLAAGTPLGARLVVFDVVRDLDTGSSKVLLYSDTYGGVVIVNFAGRIPRPTFVETNSIISDHLRYYRRQLKDHTSHLIIFATATAV